MEPGNSRKGSVSQYMLAGLETGILAALSMLAWLGISSMWYRRSFWTTANLLASTFYGESALRNRFTVHTFSGLALLLLLYGSIGILFGLAVQNRRGVQLLGFGLLEGIAFYFLVFSWMLKHWNPLIALYAHDRPMLAGHVLYGVMLGCYAVNLRRLLPETRQVPLPQAALPAPDAAIQPPS